MLLLSAAASATASSASTGEFRNVRGGDGRPNRSDAARGVPGSPRRARRLPEKKAGPGSRRNPVAGAGPPRVGPSPSDDAADDGESGSPKGRRKKGKPKAAADGRGGSPGRPAPPGDKKAAQRRPRTETSPDGKKAEPAPRSGLRTSVPDGTGGWEPPPSPSAGAVVTEPTTPPPSGQPAVTASPAAGAPSAPPEAPAATPSDGSPPPTAAGGGGAPGAGPVEPVESPPEAGPAAMDVAAAVPQAHGLPPCPPRYDPARTDYTSGSAIEMDGHYFVCLPDLDAYCNMPSRDPAWSEAEEDLWIVAWDHVGACAGTAGPEMETMMAGVVTPAGQGDAGAEAAGSQTVEVEGIIVDDFVAVDDVIAVDDAIAIDDFIAVEDVADIAGAHDDEVTTEPHPRDAYQPTLSSVISTTATAAHVLPDCPPPYDTGASYRANDEVEVDGSTFVCLGGEYESYCGAPYKDEAWDEFEIALWNDAWQHVSSCRGPEVAPTPATAAPLPADDDDGWGLSGGVIATLSPPDAIETDAAVTTAAATDLSDFVERLQGSPCVESYCSYELSDATVVKYQVVIPVGTSPAGGCDGCAVNVEVVHDRPGVWLGVGFSPDGEAGGSDAIVGVPAYGGTPASVARYTVRDGGVDALPGPDQTLRNAGLTTVYEKTVMTFTKLLRDETGTVISPVWNNIWLFSYGDLEGSSLPGTQEWTVFDITLL